MRELSEIAEGLALKFKDKFIFENNNEDFITSTLRQKLQEVDDTYAHYTCEDCGLIVNNQIFKYVDGNCNQCGHKLKPMEESSYNQLFENQCLTCPQCDSILPRDLHESQRECPVCGKYMDIFAPIHNKNKKK